MSHLLKNFKSLIFHDRKRPIPAFSNHILYIHNQKYLLCHALVPDIPEMLALRQQVAPAEIAWNFSVFEAEVKNTQQKLYLLLRFQDRLVAFIGAEFYLHKAEIHVTNLAVAKEFQRQGLATNLLASLEELGRQNNYRTISLEVRKSNLIAQRLYIKFGFLVIGTLKSYYQSNQEDAVVMKYLVKRKTKG
ncbi:ribosomal-protein-alanine N-acetyltransferase [Liquorilactobacillus vini DSM 20605]|uniref:Ribosomal-protein-alanine N-acetyltransferase n=1 Tax=Liquorilactobacillus vini DSM 20605 TaxID=1133569 RepID=A0A0R2CH18_9LACO|nr:ribosomal-protein-alanine N-acetyltransferase [Liquorilactobacillus vini DSM 20605]